MKNIVILFSLLLPCLAQRQKDPLKELKIRVGIHEPLKEVTCKYKRNKAYQDNLRIFFKTGFQFWPDSAVLAGSYNFNVDSAGTIASIVIVADAADSAFTRGVMGILGPPDEKSGFSTSFSEKTNYTYGWMKSDLRLVWDSLFEYQYLVITGKDFRAKDCLKFNF